VRGVGDEVPLGVEGGFQAGEQLIEGVAEGLELVVGAAQGQPLVQAAGRDAAGGGGDHRQRAQDPPGHEPAERKGDHSDDRQRDGRIDQHLPQVARGYLLAQRELQVRELARAESLEAPVDRDEAGRNLYLGEGRFVDLPPGGDGLLGKHVADGEQDRAAGQEQPAVQGGQP